MFSVRCHLSLVLKGRKDRKKPKKCVGEGEEGAVGSSKGGLQNWSTVSIMQKEDLSKYLSDGSVGLKCPSKDWDFTLWETVKR